MDLQTKQPVRIERFPQLSLPENDLFPAIASCYAVKQCNRKGDHMKINVTREDIRKGKPGRPTECMVALALKRELGIPYASVGYREAKILVDGQYTKLYIPRKVEQKIRFWDGFRFVFPFSFELVPSGWLTGSAITFRGQKVHPTPALICGSLQTT